MPSCLREKAQQFDGQVEIQRPEFVVERGRIFEPKDVEIFREENCVKVEDDFQEQRTSLDPEIIENLKVIRKPF